MYIDSFDEFDLQNLCTFLVYVFVLDEAINALLLGHVFSGTNA